MKDNPIRNRARALAWNRAHPERRAEIQAKYDAKRPPRVRTPEQAARNNAAALSRYHELRHAAILAYGGRCACCSEVEYDFLQLDHVNNDGGQHREEITGCRGTSGPK